MSNAAKRLAAVRTRMKAAATAASRRDDELRLIAVGKTFGAERIAELAAAGQRDFGENYLDEALEKIRALREHPIRWHFIGPLQSNKTRAVAEHFDWVHSVDREKIARRLSAQRPPALGELSVCVQVNISGESSKSGVAPDRAAALCEAVAACPNLRLVGLMAIPDPDRDAGTQYRALAELREALRTRGHDMNVLSAGMSGDLEQAVAHGATHLRIGTALFGARAPRPG